MKISDIDQIILRVRVVIAEVTGNDLEDIFDHTSLEDELGVTDNDFALIILALNKEFEAHLSMKLTMDEVQTVRDLAVLVREETLFG